MNLTNAPKSKHTVLNLQELEERLAPLVGTPIELTRKARTDGANIRKIVSDILSDRVSNALEETQYEILPPKGKGIPRILLELIDTYVVTSGDTYNLQVWNRIPNSNAPLIRYSSGEVITAQDIRFVMVKVDMENGRIESIVILTPEYIEETFGKFGKPTIKQQLLVSNIQRQKIVLSESHAFVTSDTKTVAKISSSTFSKPTALSSDEPIPGKLFSLDVIQNEVVKQLLGMQLLAPDTKTRGQLLERTVISLLGYGEDSKLVGGYPDIPNQLLEVKVQDTQTIDLGRYSPQFVETINAELNLSTEDVRYLIALTNPDTQAVEGVILSSGRELGSVFTYVSDKSYKCQRSIPMVFFDDYIGYCVSNPE